MAAGFGEDPFGTVRQTFCAGWTRSDSFSCGAVSLFRKFHIEKRLQGVGMFGSGCRSRADRTQLVRSFFKLVGASVAADINAWYPERGFGL